MTALSILDLAPITEGSDAAQSFRNSLDLAQHAEQWGYMRFWLAEHHGMPGIASAATAVLIGHVAGGTKRIRVGAGGIMLPNHSPLMVAEQFGTLESLYPGRIDLGLGWAPGSDQRTLRALRRDPVQNPDQFPEDVAELLAYFDQPRRHAVRAIPGEGLGVPVWILGSSLYGAQLAAAMGLPYAFASHFAPAQLQDALHIYRASFRPSPRCKQPHVMLGFNVVAAETDEQARVLATSAQQAFIHLRNGFPGRFPPPQADYLDTLLPPQRAMLDSILACSAVGSPETVLRTMQEFIAHTLADELMITSQIFDHAARLRSYEIVAELMSQLRAN